MLFPGSLALHNRSLTLAEVQRVDWIVKSGRALLLHRESDGLRLNASGRTPES